MSLKSYINMLKVAILELCIYIVRYFVGFKMVQDFIILLRKPELPL